MDPNERLNEIGVIPLVRSVAREHRTTVREVLGGARNPAAARARRHVWALLVWTLGLGYAEVARLFGADHATVLAGVRKHQAELEAQYAGVRA